MQTRSIVRVLAVTAGVAIALPCAAVYAQTPSLATSPRAAASKVRTAADAASLLRDLFFMDDAQDAAELGSDFSRRFPNDSRVRAWYVASLVGVGGGSRADSLTMHTDTLSKDPWALAARSLARLHAEPAMKSNYAEARRLAARARSLAPSDPYLAWLGAFTLVGTPGFPMRGFDDEIVYIDSVAPKVGNPALLRVMRADALYSAASGPATAVLTGKAPPLDTAKRNAAFREYAAVREADPNNFAAYYRAGIRLSLTQEDSALALMRRAVELAPRASLPRQQLWTVINRQRALSAAQKRDMIAADRAAFLVATDSAAWALAAVASSLRFPTSDPAMLTLEDRVLAKAPRSASAEQVLLRRANQWNDSIFAARDTTRPGPKSDTTVMRKRYIDAMEAFIAKPWVANPEVRGQAVASLFYAVREDTTYPTDHLVALARQLLTARTSMAPESRYGWVARALSERHVELALSEQLVRDGIKQVGKYIDEFPGYIMTSLGDRADALDHGEAAMHDDLGWVFYNAGRYAAADSEMSRAVDLDKKNVTIYRDLGRLRVAQGRNDDAELAFAQGMTIRYRGINPNLKELETIYRQNHISMDGWSAYLGALSEKEKATRRARILATRDSSPKLHPPFKLADLAGRITESDTLRSKFVVVNFWGMWCGPCVAEMPELQQFYDKYKGDRSVSVLTISNDKDLAELKDWMAARRLTIPTLFDDGYVAKTANIMAFPSTWFIAPDGNTQFVAVGNTGALVEEWSWRLEAMRAKPAAVVPEY
jgi:thiol-disulfide isomerase/thioredoxin/Flp pilus assembly protein TadD